LADEVGITLATMSGLVAELERAGFVRRATDPSDRRRTIVALVPGRDAVIEKWLDGVTAPMVRALGKLSPEERATFVKAMEFLEAELNRGPAERRRLEQPSSVGNSTAGGSPRSLVEEPAL
jgi:DNA-binding MarR family transcriptional regulator